MKKILVTGATGFIGNYVLQALIKTGYEIIATSTSLENARTKSWFRNVTFLEYDLKKYDSTVNYQAYFHYPDAVIHLAWEGLPNYKSSFHIDENLPRHYLFLSNLIQHGLTDLTVTGTCFEYGMQEGCLTEDLLTQPANAYAIAKDGLHKQLLLLQELHPFQFKWVRLFYMYGAGQNPNSLLSQLDKALENGEEIFKMSGGEQVRDYLPVEKVADYIVSIALQNEVNGVINCCSSEPIKIKTLVENYLKQKGSTIELNTGYYPYSDYEPMHFWGDNRKLTSILKNNFKGL